jgi:hypothetical protein
MNGARQILQLIAHVRNMTRFSDIPQGINRRYTPQDMHHK